MPIHLCVYDCFCTTMAELWCHLKYLLSGPLQKNICWLLLSLWRPNIYLLLLFSPCVVAVVAQSCLTLCDPMDCSPPRPLSMRFPRQEYGSVGMHKKKKKEYWSGLPFPSSGNLLDPGIEAASISCVEGRFCTAEPRWKPNIYLYLQVACFPCGSAGKESACSVGDLGSIPGLGRSPGEGKAYPLQYSGLENSMDCIDHGVAKSRTQLSNFHFHRWRKW